jgi:hypothetical protein
MAKQGIIPVRVSSTDRAALKAAAGEQPVSTWLRDLGLAEAKRRASARSVGEILDAMAGRGPHMTDEEAAELADEAVQAVRRSRRR